MADEEYEALDVSDDDEISDNEVDIEEEEEEEEKDIDLIESVDDTVLPEPIIIDIDNDKYNDIYPHISKYEMTTLIGVRAEQLARGAQPLVDIGMLTDPIEIAIKEWQEKKQILLVYRLFNSKISGKYYEVIKPLSELIQFDPVY